MVHVHPGESEPEDCDYWWSQEHDRRFFTFIDKYPEGSQPEFVNHLSAAHRVRLHTLLACSIDLAPAILCSLYAEPYYGKLLLRGRAWDVGGGGGGGGQGGGGGGGRGGGGGGRFSS